MNNNISLSPYKQDPLSLSLNMQSSKRFNYFVYSKLFFILTDVNVTDIKISNKTLKEQKSVKYLGVLFWTPISTGNITLMN